MARPSGVRRRHARLTVGTAIVSLIVLAAGPAFAHEGEGHATKKSKKKTTSTTVHDMSKMKGMDHSASATKATKAKRGMIVLDGALTGDSPCELSGPPASVGQVKKDAEGHDHRGPLQQYPMTRAEREQLIEQQAQARSVADKYPTVASAEADGYKKSTPYVPCIGAHYTKVSLVSKFDPAAPSELLYDGTNPDSKIVGLSYLILNPGGAPEGFAGPNDQWHQHNSNGGLCLNSQFVVIGNEATTKKECEARGGKKAKLDDIWMVHDWVVPGWECGWGVFAGECPELGGRVGGTVWDEPDPKAFAKATGSKGSKSSAKETKSGAKRKKTASSN